MTTTAEPFRWYEVPLVPALLALHLMLECAWTLLDSLLSDDSVAETFGLGAGIVALEVLFLFLVWRQKKWAWYVVAVLSVLSLATALLGFAAHDVWGYDETPSVSSALALAAVTLASTAVWFAPALRAHALRRA